MTHTSADLDERTLAYVVDAQRPFDDLRHAVAQISGWLVLAALHTRDAVGDHPALVRADALIGDSIAAMREIRVTDRARVHYNCLSRAGQALASAIRDARTRPRIRTDADIRRVSATVRTAYAQLARAAAALPGFELISFEHACVNHNARITSHPRS